MYRLCFKCILLSASFHITSLPPLPFPNINTNNIPLNKLHVLLQIGGPKIFTKHMSPYTVLPFLSDSILRLFFLFFYISVCFLCVCVCVCVCVCSLACLSVASSVVVTPFLFFFFFRMMSVHKAVFSYQKVVRSFSVNQQYRLLTRERMILLAISESETSACYHFVGGYIVFFRFNFHFCSGIFIYFFFFYVVACSHK